MASVFQKKSLCKMHNRDIKPTKRFCFPDILFIKTKGLLGGQPQRWNARVFVAFAIQCDSDDAIGAAAPMNVPGSVRRSHER
jgi:hypothetical protein